MDEVIICDDIFLCICDNLRLIKILELQLLDKHHKSLIRKYRFINTKIIFFNKKRLNYLIKNFNFTNYSIYDNITDITYFRTVFL